MYQWRGFKETSPSSGHRSPGSANYRRVRNIFWHLKVMFLHLSGPNWSLTTFTSHVCSQFCREECFHNKVRAAQGKGSMSGALGHEDVPVQQRPQKAAGSQRTKYGPFTQTPDFSLKVTMIQTWSKSPFSGGGMQVQCQINLSVFMPHSLVWQFPNTGCLRISSITSAQQC